MLENKMTRGTSAAPMVFPRWVRACSRKPKLAVDDGDRLPPDADHLRFAILRLDGHLEPTRVMDLHPLFHDEGRRGQLATRREVGGTCPRGAARRGVLQAQVRRETSGMHRRIGCDGLQRERVADDFLAELRHHLLQRSQIGIEGLHDIEGTKRDLEGWDPRRGNPRDEALRTDVSRANPEGFGERRDALQFRAEGRLALRHDHLPHLPAFADQLERQDANLELLVDDRRTVRMRDEPLKGGDERRPDRGVAREGNLAAWREDPISVVRGRIARRKDERRLGEVHLPGDGTHLGRREARRAMEYRERVSCEGRVREYIDPPEIEEPFRHGPNLRRRMVCPLLMLLRQVFGGPFLPRAKGEPSPPPGTRAGTTLRSRTRGSRIGSRSSRNP